MLAALHQKMRFHLAHILSRASDSLLPIGSDVPDGFIFTPRELWDGDCEKGRWLVHGGVFSYKGDQLELHNANWHPKEAAPVWIEHLHGFGWLNDLRALGGDQGRLAARAMVQNWMDAHPYYEPESWRTDILGRRIANLIAGYDFFGDSASDAFQEQFFYNLIKQVKHLSRSMPGMLEGLPLLYGIKGLAYAGLTLEGRERDLECALNLLEREMKAQFHNDGGHVSRNADQLFEALKILVDLRGTLKQAGYPPLETIQTRLEQSLPALRFFRHGDKRFALFAGMQEGEDKPVQQLFQMSGVRARAVNSLPQTGFERISAGKSLLMVDCAAPLAFEFSHGRERIFVNCGSHPTDADWQSALRGAPAFNTLTIDDRGPSEVRRSKPVQAERRDKDGHSSLEVWHEGYKAFCGVVHRRALSLDEKGFELCGQEILTCPKGLMRSHRVLARFHIHPRVLISLVQDGTQALLRLKSGFGFRFKADGAQLSLENSIYLGSGVRPLKTKQIVLRALMEEDSLEIGWSLTKE